MDNRNADYFSFMLGKGMFAVPVMYVKEVFEFTSLTPVPNSLGYLRGVMNIRVVHYFMMFVFIIFMCIHVYLANIEGIAPTKLIFFRKEHGGLVYDPEKRNVVGFDGLGHEPSYGEAPSARDLDAEGVKC